MVATPSLGMDVAEVRELGAALRSGADEMRRVASRLDGLVQSVSWAGPDGQRFLTSWWPQHRAHLIAAAEELGTFGQRAMDNAAEQEEASTGSHQSGEVSGGVAHGGGSTGPVSRPVGVPGAITDVTISSAGWIGFGSDVVETIRGEGNGVIAKLPHGGILDKGLKVVGVADAMAGTVEGIQNRDWSGTAMSVADGGFTFASAPVSVLYTGLKTELGFFIPLDESAQSEHMGWMSQQGHSSSEIADRYSGVQGYINLGNDNVERKAPWMNDVADKLAEKPAEWLYNAGIKL